VSPRRHRDDGRRPPKMGSQRDEGSSRDRVSAQCPSRHFASSREIKRSYYEIGRGTAGARRLTREPMSERRRAPSALPMLSIARWWGNCHIPPIVTGGNATGAASRLPGARNRIPKPAFVGWGQVPSVGSVARLLHSGRDRFHGPSPVFPDAPIRQGLHKLLPTARADERNATPNGDLTLTALRATEGVAPAPTRAAIATWPHGHPKCAPDGMNARRSRASRLRGPSRPSATSREIKRSYYEIFVALRASCQLSAVTYSPSTTSRTLASTSSPSRLSLPDGVP
jgi:hypothetical protein